jgi:acetyl esterase/lipase
MSGVPHSAGENAASPAARGSGPGAWLRFALAALILFVAMWIVVPPPGYGTLALAVGAAELGQWLIVVGMAVLFFAVRAGTGWIARVTVLCAVAAVALASIPLFQFPATARRFDAAMQDGLGPDYLSGVAPDARGRMRRSPLDLFQLFTGLNGGGSRVVRGVAFAVNDGVHLSMDIYRPAARGTHPAIVQIYGGAWQRGAPGDNATFASYLAAHGYVVFAIDYRHAPRWQWPAQLADVRTALEWIAVHGKEYEADAGRLALIGRSSGAQLALVAAYASGGPPVRAVVSYYGPVNLVEGYRRPPRPDPLDVRSIESAFLGGTPDDALDRYRSASPITYAERPLPSTLLVYAARDHVVEARFGEMLYQKLRATGTTSVLLEIPWAEHAFDAVTGGPGAQLALYHTERFLAWAFSAPAGATTASRTPR